MKIENEILKKASRAFTAETKLPVRFYNGKDKVARFGLHHEATLEIDLGESTVSILAEVKTNTSDAGISNTGIRAKQMGKNLAIVTRYVPPRHAKIMRDLGLSYLDTAGNAYVKEPGLFILISGKRAKIETEKPSRNIFVTAGVKAIYAFIQKPGLEILDYRSIEEETGVPRSSIARVIDGLEASGFIVKRADRERHLIRKPELIKRWSEAFAETFRPKLKPVWYHSTKYKGRWWNDIDIGEYDACWGGEPGGAKLTKYLRPQTITIYADNALPRLQAKYGLVRDPRGECEILKRFWKFGENEDTAPPLVVYADLLATADERNIETARMIYDQYLAPLAEENT